MKQNWMRTVAVLALAAGALMTATSAQAADKVRVAKSGLSLLFNSVHVGEAAGIWKSLDLEIEAIQMDGEAPMEKAMTSGDLDIALASGTSGAFHIKGVPQTPVAQLSGAPADFVVIVDPNSKFKDIKDLKGKKLGVTARGSLTDWLVHEASRIQGWGDDGIESVGISNLQARLAAMKNGDIDGMITTPETASDYAEHGQAKIMLYFGDHVHDFVAHAILAHNDLIQKKPEVLQRFLKGWFMTVAWMKKKENEDKAVEVLADTLKISKAAAKIGFESDVKAMSDDGAWDTKGLDVVRKSLPSFGLLDYVPEIKDLVSDKFVPVKL
jgi:NitT/TauT family transport system substrate-binding protein